METHLPRRKTSKKTRSTPPTPPSLLRKGVTYLFEGEEPSKAFLTFKKVLSEKKKGLCISRRYPPHLKEDFQLDQIPIYWLTRRKDEMTLDPVQLNGISHIVQQFIDISSPTIVLLDGIEYLIIQNDFKPVLRFIQHIRDEVLIQGSNLLLTLSPETLSLSEVRLLERDLEVFEVEKQSER